MGGTLFINPYLSWMPNLFRLSDVAELVAERLPSDSTEARERCLLAAGDIPHLNVRDWSPIEMECLFGAANDLVEEWVVRARWDTTEVFSNLAALCCADPRVAKPHYSQTCSLLLPNSQVWEAKGYYYDFTLNFIAAKVFERQQSLGHRLLQGRMKVGAQICDLRQMTPTDLDDLGESIEVLRRRFIEGGVKIVKDPEWDVLYLPSILRLLNSFEASQRL
ncbi:MAG TPA: hypothetical protein PLQ56_21740 [Aggregatilineales bacterium]|nr:hypothetical protein [Aggregatilineales bacterium]